MLKYTFNKVYGVSQKVKKGRTCHASTSHEDQLVSKQNN